MKCYLVGLILVLGIGNSFANDVLHWQNTSVINSDWLYLEKDTDLIPTEADGAYEKINLPHTWNAEDTLKSGPYRRAGSWYRKNITITAADLEKRIYMRFNAAGQQAKVFVGGKLVMEHIGGYSAFTCELTDKIKLGKNQVNVWVSNKGGQKIPPLSGDFNVYGGLYRSVLLVRAPKVSISRKHLGGPGFRKWSSDVSDNAADFHLKVLLDNGSAQSASLTLVSELLDPSGKTVLKSNATAAVAANQTSYVDLKFPTLANPQLWSPESPTLYTMNLKVMQNGKVIDVVSAKHGFRWFRFDANRGFFLNGKPYKLNGANRHQDFEGEGNAVPLKRHLDDIKLMKELGINWLRLAHYQQDDYILQLCNELGILVWEEIPYVDRTSFEPEFEANLRSMMKDLIEQHFNNSSIILWGMGNEIHMKKRPDGKAKCYDIIKGLNDIIHTEDSTRKSVYVTGDVTYATHLKIVEMIDVLGYNLYRGWYADHYDNFTKRCEHLHKMDPGKPLIISEFGAGSDMNIHSENPARQDFSTEFQNDFLESHLKQIAKMDWLCGVNWWNYADFGSARRGNSIPRVNQKGVVTFTRKKKDSFYLMKSMWSKEPVVYIESATWKKRGGAPEKTYRVFSNMKSVELFHNNVSLGKQSSEFSWKVVLTKGENIIKAVGSSGSIRKEHSITTSFTKSRVGTLAVASVESNAHFARNAIDGNLKTRWSAVGSKQWIQLDMGHILLVDGVNICFHNGEKTIYKLAIKGSQDKENWVEFFDGKSTKNDGFEKFLFKEQPEIRYLRIEAKGNEKSGWNGYSEIKPMISHDKKEKSIYEKMGAGDAEAN